MIVSRGLCHMIQESSYSVLFYIKTWPDNFKLLLTRHLQQMQMSRIHAAWTVHTRENIFLLLSLPESDFWPLLTDDSDVGDSKLMTSFGRWWQNFDLGDILDIKLAQYVTIILNLSPIHFITNIDVTLEKFAFFYFFWNFWTLNSDIEFSPY